MWDDSTLEEYAESVVPENDIQTSEKDNTGYISNEGLQAHEIISSITINR